tara:strand:+ start:326 stop:748 length:423 start_codon:yes stop_codon:yes gene_type:complete
MKNILGKTEDLTFYNKEGALVYCFCTNSESYSNESTHDESGNELSYKNSDGYYHKRTYDESGNTLTYRNSDDYSQEFTRDESGYVLTYKNSNGYWEECTRDKDGNELTFKNSVGEIRGFYIPEFTMEELTQKLGNFKLIK